MKPQVQKCQKSTPDAFNEPASLHDPDSRALGQRQVVLFPGASLGWIWPYVRVEKYNAHKSAHYDGRWQKRFRGNKFAP